MRTEQRILKTLLDSSAPVTSQELSFRLGISERTALKYLNILKAELIDSGAEIRVKQRLGSYISITDGATFHLFLQKFNSDSLLEDPTIRKMYVLMRLIVDSNYINVYDLADEIAVSPSLLRSIIRELPDLLDRYHLKLVHNRLRGYRISGSEADIRRCLSRECRTFQVLNDVLIKKEFHNDEQNAIHEIITSALKQYNIAISSDSIDALTLHTLIAVNRLETGNPIRIEQNHEILQLKTRPDYFATCRINDELQKKLGISLPESELIYLTMHISGKQRIFGHEHLQVAVDSRALHFYNSFLRNIYMLSNEDFFEDYELRTSLLNHIVPFLNRVDSNMQIEKTEMNNIKSEFPYAYDLAVTGLSGFEKKNIRITEAEISYFSLHLELSMEKRRESKHMKYNVLLICREASSIYQILSYKLNKYFSDSIREVVFTSPHHLTQYDLEDFQFILCTTDPNPSYPKETVYISSFINDEDINIIRNSLNQLGSRIAENVVLKKYLFMDLSAESKEEVLKQMTERISQYITLPDDFLSRVESREKLASTELDNRIAIPHPISSSDMPGFVCIARTDKPFLWAEKPVQMIFLVSSSSDINPWLYSKIAKIISHPALSQSLIEAADFSEFVSIFEKI